MAARKGEEGRGTDPDVNVKGDLWSWRLSAMRPTAEFDGDCPQGKYLTAEAIPASTGGEEGDGAERANLEGIQGVRLMLEKEHAHGGSSTSLATAQSVDEVLAKLLRGLSVDGTLDGKPTDMR
eukprot:gene22709-27411_t